MKAIGFGEAEGRGQEEVRRKKKDKRVEEIQCSELKEIKDQSFPH